MWLPWPWAAALTGLCLGLAWLVRERHAGWHSVLRETAVLSALYTAWRIVGRISVIHPEGAFERAEWLWDLQRTLLLPNERDWQAMILDTTWLVKAANIYYGGAHVPLMGVFLVWAFFRHRPRYGRWRNVLAASTLGCVFLQLLPLAPPRLMPDFGLVDTPALYGQSVYPAAVGASLSGQLQAMPSIHVGWAALIAAAVWSLERGPARLVGVLHLLATMWVVVVTGNHYWLDGVVAIAVLALTIWAHDWLRAQRHGQGDATTAESEPPDRVAVEATT